MKRAPSITSAEMRAQVMKAEVEQVHTMNKKTIFSLISREKHCSSPSLVSLHQGLHKSLASDMDKQGLYFPAVYDFRPK